MQQKRPRSGMEFPMTAAAISNLSLITNELFAEKPLRHQLSQNAALERQPRPGGMDDVSTAD